MDKKQISKFLSLVLRHQPEKIGLKLDNEGYGDVSVILEKTGLTLVELEDIVDTNDKKRFSFNQDKTKIRASQGHSVDTEIKFKNAYPDFKLYHGTQKEKVDSILKSGLNKGNRHHVHLAKDQGTSVTVGMRKGSAVILEIDAPQMLKDGHQIFISDNGVYLIEFVPPIYIRILK